MHSPANLSTFLADWRNFPHRLDFRSGRLLYLRVDARTLESSAFLDGRTALSVTGEEYVVELEDALGCWSDTGCHQRPPLILHTAFCGSTLLARMLTQPGRVVCLREPQILADIAAWHAALPVERRKQTVPALRFALAQLGRSPGGAAIAIKPTNWINPMLPEMVDAGVERAVWLTSDLRTLLIAALRGGNDRIAYLSRYAVHAARSQSPLDSLIRQATVTGSSLEKALRLSALSLLAQQSSFAEIAPRFDEALHINFSALIGDPQATAARAAAALGLEGFAGDASLSASLQTHAKADAAFDGAREVAVNEDLFRRYGAEILGAERWATKVAAPQLA